MFYLIYIACLFFICITIYQLISQKLMNEDFTFLIACNYLLNITTALFFGYYNSLSFALISSFALSIFATLLIYKIALAFNRLKFYSLPYLALVYFVFFFILFNLL